MKSTPLRILFLTLLMVLFAPMLNAADLGEQIDIGLIIEPGASHISGYLEVLAARKGVRSVAVAVSDKDMLQNAKRQLGKRFHGNGFLSAKQMLAKVRPALTVVTMEGVNAPAAIRAALQAGSHVLTEKPSCTKLEQFEELAKLADKRKRHLMLAMATRSGAALKKARQLIAAGEIGNPIRSVWYGLPTRHGWRTRPTTNPGFLTPSVPVVAS